MGVRQADLDLLSALTAGLPDAVTYPSNPPELPIPWQYYVALGAMLLLSTLMLVVTWLYNRKDIYEGLSASAPSAKDPKISAEDIAGRPHVDKAQARKPLNVKLE